ncbi:MAG: hypothetical protein JOZ83_16295 [Silvibacterium sp.]|nr:hypothetical protein [Silvibacterium sp.]
MRPINRFLTVAVTLLSAPLMSAFAQANWAVVNTLHIGGDGGWDYVTVDPRSHRLFVTRTTHTQVIDADSGKVLGDIPGQIRSHGVAIVPSLNRGFITDGGGSGAIIVFDLNNYSVLGRIATVPDSDGIIYDEKSNLVLAVSGDGGVLMTFKPDIDPKSGKIDPPITLGGAPEFLAADDAGKVYINLEDKDLVAVVDLASRKIIARWPVAPGGHPVGMAMDPVKHRLFIGCRNPQKLVEMNSDTGKVESSVPIGAGVDAVGLAKGHAFASCRDGSLVTAAIGAQGLKIDQSVKTPDGARTLGVDSATNRFYLPTAEFEPATTGRPKAKPGTFMIVVVAQQ